MKTMHRLVPLLAALTLTAVGGLPVAANARTTKLGATPPDLTTSVAPNIAITFDDSGSMQSYYMGDNRPFDNKAWTTNSRYSNPWVCAGVIDPRAKTGVRTLAMNGVYFNPNATYAPPKRADGTSFPNADATLTMVWLNGIDINRTDNKTTADPNDWVQSNTNSSSGFKDDRVTYPTNTSVPWGCSEDLANPFGGGPYYYRLKTGVDIGTVGAINTANLYNKDNWEAVQVPSTKYQDFANWLAYYRTRNMMTRTAMSLAFAKIGNSVRIAWQNMANATSTKNGAVSVQFGDTAQLQDIGDLNSSVRAAFYKWLLQVAGGNSTPSRRATIRASQIFRASLSKDANDPYWNGLSGTDSKELTCRKNFHMLVTDGYWNDNSDDLKPIALGTADNGAPAMDSTNVATVSQSLPDGTAYDPASTRGKVYGNVAGTSVPLSLANIAWYFWATDLQPGLDNNVKGYFQDVTSASPVDVNNPGKNLDVYWNPLNDPATWQHVSQFFVTLGVAGTLTFPDDLVSLKDGTKAWPQPKNNSAEAVDDTWHAAINSRGGYFGASDPTSLVSSLVAIINSVLATTSSSVSPGLNTGVLSAGSQMYKPEFSSIDWSGKLYAYSITAAGGQGSLLWTANTLLDATAAKSRKIATSTGSGKGPGVEFLYDNLSTSQKAIMDASDPDNVTSSPDANGEKRVNWVRGSHDDEGTLLRPRATLLGAIINGQPLYVGYPSSGYRDYFPPSSDGTTAPETTAYNTDSKYSYSQYVSDNLSRSPTLYVPANDGMIHALDVSSPTNGGPERWAFIPDAVYRNLWFLSKKDKPAYFPTVDSTPISRDVFFNGPWHTLLVGGLRLGGRGIYALDVTNPVASSGADAGKKVLWEFNSSASNGANLGYTFGQPNIGRLSNGRWVVLVPAGYFPYDSTYPGNNAAAASNTYSSLFVLDAETGAVLAEYKTPTLVGSTKIESWGLASPVMGDYNNDQIDDVAFAGDLAGNLWRFDLTDLTKKTVDLVYQPATAGDQPITVMPRLFPDPTSQYFIVVFGTGKFLGDDDRTTTGAKVQSVYGVRDPGLGNTTGLPWTRANLVVQQIAQDSTGLRGITQNPAPTTSLKGGWYFDLNIASAPGEKVVVTPFALFNTNRAIITTLIPTSADPCSPGRMGAIMVVDAATGGAGAGVGGTGSFGSTKFSTAGSTVKDPPATGSLAAATMIGGGQVVIPGVTATGSGNVFSVGSPIWRRRSWRILNDQ